MEVGNLVPEFSMATTGGHEMLLKSFRGKKVVLYFYPKDSTPGCTTEGIEFNELLSEFRKAGAEVFGISRDTLSSHDKFREKFGFKFDLLADTDEKLCKIFDVIKEKNMYGKKVMGIERSTFVIDKNGRLAGEFRKIKAEGHARQMLDFVRGL